MLNLHDSLPPHPRRELRQHLMRIREENGSRMPLEAIDEIVDIACHAAESARSTLLDTLDRSSSQNVAVTAIGIAVSLLQNDLQCFATALKNYAEVTGKPLYETTLGVG